MSHGPWQPIETFPRDCVPALWWDGFCFRVAHWSPLAGGEEGAIVAGDDLEELEGGIAWMRIPKPPSLPERPPGRPFASAS